MSANDSMGIVFKCLSRGAVDFLVKPIRKNELKNLWQHVWRKCHSSSGSGSESGIQTQKSTKSKSVERSENNTDSNDKAENGSFDLDDRDGSDNGSGTQIPLYSKFQTKGITQFLLLSIYYLRLMGLNNSSKRKLYF
ncbi:hypothetical protein K7X08_028664 [Anisodus acutangulus]|uniref:Response regulatory domain-containing protein n=1 Tax=Anisodus acutangulus TaxID=402998 RepID=A0A9Q1LUN6_9SOLA|nr:hypothetical protein K7X08_028664 [Anisodus acutangulus]